MNVEDKFAKIMAGVVYHTSGYVSHARNYFKSHACASNINFMTLHEYNFIKARDKMLKRRELADVT